MVCSESQGCIGLDAMLCVVHFQKEPWWHSHGYAMLCCASPVSFSSIDLSLAGSLGSREALLLLLFGPELVFQRRGGDVGGA